MLLSNPARGSWLDKTEFMFCMLKLRRGICSAPTSGLQILLAKDLTGTFRVCKMVFTDTYFVLFLINFDIMSPALNFNGSKLTIKPGFYCIQA